MWIDVEDELPPIGERVIVLIPFGMRVEDDTWTKHGWMNAHAHVSHWQPINAPGSYNEIMQRSRGPKAELAYKKENVKISQNHDELFSKAVIEHFKLMSDIISTQIALRFEAK